MRKFKSTVMGYIFFFLTVTVLVSISILIYSTIQEKDTTIVALLILLFIAFSALVCTVIDVIRRKVMIENPLKEILLVTEQMAKGNFRVLLYPNHTYGDYDEFDLIKEDLNKMAKELSKSEVLKNDFIANVSHEIKTPLAVIQSYAKALANDKLDEQTKAKYIISLQESCSKLSNLVTNILKLNKLENKKLTPEYKKFNLSELLISQILQFEEIIEKKEIELICDIEENLEITSEESYLEIVFNNLMSNAIKFTNEKGNIKVSLKKINNEIVISFNDSGCGMDKDTGKHIFDKFYQGDTSHSKEGNGLGLALVKKVIEIIGGKISVESTLGLGTTFEIVIKEN